MSSIFTRIINREIPANILYKDDICIVILDINPVQKWHILVIPKQELPWMDDYDDETVAHCMVVAKRFMKHQKKVLDQVTHIYLIVEWVQVPHWHIHLIPCYLSTGKVEFPHSTYDDGEAESYTQVLRIK